MPDPGLGQPDGALQVVPENLARGKEVRLIGFGSWRLRAIAARKVKSIRTGKDVSLPAHKRVGFSVGATLSQYALAWICRNDAVTAPLIGPRTPAQLEDNLGALDVTIPEAHLTRIYRKLEIHSRVELTRVLLAGGIAD